VPHTIRDKKALLVRTRRIKGQAEALEKALGQDAECDAVLQQIAAIRGAINGLMAEVMEGHLRDHVAAPVSGAERQKELEPVVRLLRSYLK
jgi:DNA-binding FrmR family transcriptional regulator